LLGSPRDTKPVGGLKPHYLRRLSLQIGAAYVILVLGGLAAVGFGLRSSQSRIPPPVHIPPVVFPTTTSPAQTVSTSPAATTRASAAPSATSPSATPSATVSPVAASSDAKAAQPTVSVAYAVVADSGGQFKGQVTVENNGSAPISGWQVVVALPDDQITSFSNASGYDSDGILLLQPASSADTVPADGTLNISFTAVGSQTTPEACTFNSITCG